MALNMNYASEVLEIAHDLLWDIKNNGGLASTKFCQAEAAKYPGQRAADAVNVALVAMGKSPVFVGQATEAQMSVLVERVKKNEGLLLSQIAKLRAEKGK